MSSHTNQRDQLKRAWPIISHDLSTPLASLHMNLGHLKDTMLPILLDAYQRARSAGLDVTPIRPDRLKQFEELIQNSVSNVDFLNQYIARLNCKLLLNNEATLESLAIEDCIKSAIKNYQSRYGLKDKSDIQMDITAANIHGDEKLIHYILYELLANADYFLAAAKNNNKLSLSSEKVNGFYELHIKNTGIGISENDLPHIFAPYFSTIEKIGLGLYFCQQAMQQMQGKITCHTKADEYTEFVLTFPL